MCLKGTMQLFIKTHRLTRYTPHTYQCFRGTRRHMKKAKKDQEL